MGSILRAFGVTRPAQRYIKRPNHLRLFRSVHLTPWSARMRFGWVLCWDGPWWCNAIGIAGPDWNGGDWLGGMSWKRYGPLVVCRYRRRGSWRGDRRSARMARDLEARYGAPQDNGPED